MAPAIPERAVAVLQEDGVVTPGVRVRAAAGMGEPPVELDAEPVALVDAVGADPAAAGDLDPLPTRARQAVPPLDVVVVAPLQRRLDAGGRVREEVVEQCPTPDTKGPAPPEGGTGPRVVHAQRAERVTRRA
jgi:hypothetical protein